MRNYEAILIIGQFELLVNPKKAYTILTQDFLKTMFKAINHKYV